MRLPFLIFVLAALPLSAAVLRHGVPNPVDPLLESTDAGSIGLKWLAPSDPKPELGLDANGDEIAGPVSAYEIHVTSVPPPELGPSVYPWFMLSSESGESNAAWAESVPVVDGAPEPADPGLWQDFTITGLEPLTTYYIFIVDFDDHGSSSTSPLLEVTTSAAVTPTPTPTVSPIIGSAGGEEASGGFCSAACGASAWVVAALVAALPRRRRS